MVDPVLLSAQAAEIRQMNTEEVDVEVRSEAYQVTLQNEAKKVHENKLKRITKLTDVHLIRLEEARARLQKWNAKSELETRREELLVRSA